MSIVHHWDDVEVVSGPPVAKRMLKGAGASLVRVTIPAGTSSARHSHDFEQIVQVISGRGTLETEAGVAPFEAGNLFHFPPHTWHAAEFETDTVLVETNLRG